MNPNPDWTLYRTFLAVLDAGSLSAAARALHLTQPTVARHVDALEASLGITLFLRSQLGLQPTEAGSALRPFAETMAATAAALLRARAGLDQVAGTVRITASDVVGGEVLPPILARLRADHPALAIELTLTDRVEDLMRRDADIAVRMVAPTQEALLARRIGTVALGLFGHPDYLKRKGTPRRMADLACHDLIGYDVETPAVVALRSRFAFPGRDTFALRTDSNLVQLAAIRAGFGLGICQVPLGRKGDALVHLLPEEVALDLPVWLAMHEDLKSSARCRAVFDGLAERLRSYLA
jgi:DNA-binding transcriptional LysR family regulator